MSEFEQKVNKQFEVPKEVIIDDVVNISRGSLCFKQVSYWRCNMRYSMAVKLLTDIPSIGKTCSYDYLAENSIFLT